MKLGIMQPYFFPYLGYWQLIHAVDTFVVYDDVAFIKQGFINRNYILVNGEKKLFTIPVQKISSYKLINDTYIDNEVFTIKKFKKKIIQEYKKAPFYNDIMKLLDNIFSLHEERISMLNYISINAICEYLQINTKIILSSHINKNNLLKSEDRVIDICRCMGATTYINAIGGKDLYHKDDFEKSHLNLMFIQKQPIFYKQYNNMFIDDLSIIDVLMFNDKITVQRFLDSYTLVPGV